jgi:hypothetical protein
VCGHFLYYIVAPEPICNAAHDRFLNFHGLPHARLDLDQSVYDAEKRPQSVLFRALSFFLFFAPEVYLQSLEKAYTDKTVLVRVWKPLIHKLNTEWQDFTLLVRIYPLFR